MAMNWLCRMMLALALISAATAASAEPRLWRLEGWDKTDFSKKSIDFSEILSGGPPKDGIPSIDKPLFTPVAQEKQLGNDEPVIALAINGDARAYPLRVLIWHEIVNDTVGSKPVTVTYCPLCNSAIVFERNVGGRLLDFGTTGKLRNSDLVMYDRQTQSWWQQFTGTAIVGEMTGTELKTIPARLESFDRFRARFPGGQVLIPNNPEMRAYGRNPYVSYDSRHAPYPLFNGELPSNIDPMIRVVTVKSGGKPRAVTLNLLRKKGIVTLGDVELSWARGQNSALDSATISQGRDVGNIVARRKTANGLQDVVYDVTFAFVFNAFYPGETIRQD